MRAFTMLLRVLLASCLTISTMGSVVAQTSNQTLNDEATAAITSGNYALAAEKYREILDQSPDWASGHVALAQCHFLLGQPEEGEASFARARDADAAIDLFPAYFNLGRQLLHEKNPGAAVLPFERALEVAPEAQRAGVYDHLAMSHRQLGNTPLALDALRNTLALEAEGERRIQKARQLARLSSYWALSPENRQQRSDALAEAVEDVRQWVTLDPSDEEAMVLYGDTMLAAGRAADLIDELSGRERTAGTSAQCLLLSEAYLALDEFERSEHWARQALSGDADLARAQLCLARSLVNRLRPSHSSLATLREDQQVATQIMTALVHIGEIGDISEGRRERAEELRTQVEHFLEALSATEAEFMANQLAYDTALADDKRSAIKLRCDSLGWEMRTNQRMLTPEEELFYGDNCRN